MSPLSDAARQRLMGAATKGRTVESLADQLHEEGVPDPLADIEYTGDVEADMLAEFAALLAAMETAADRPPPEWMHTSRSALWCCIVFLTRHDKEWFLMTIRVYELADKYVAIEDFEFGLAQTAKLGPASIEYRVWTPPVWTHNTDGEPITPQQLAFRQAAARDTYNAIIEGDSETWFCLTFRTPEQKQAWLAEHPPIEGTRFHDGYLVAASYGIDIPRRPD